jgi:hypothetical protein
MSEMKRGPQGDTLILSAGPTSCRNCSVICPQNSWEPDALGLKSILSGSSLLCNWLHVPQESGMHIENKASHRDILCAG